MVQMELLDWEKIFQQIRVWCTFNPFIVYLFFLLSHLFNKKVDLECPQELHDLHNDYPLPPEKVKVSKSMLSGYCKKIADKYKILIGLVSKLIPLLRDKKEYVFHYRNLQLYLDLGLKIKKVHGALKFDQSPWLKQYIDFNTEK